MRHQMEIYGHRGAKGVVMENSLQGFISTAKEGIERFELDIRLSADNQLIVVHDERLMRLANSPLLVSQTHSDELSKILLNNTSEGIPKLSDVVKACPSIKHWQFEIKTDTNNTDFIEPMKQLINTLELHQKVTITSLHRGILKSFKSALPKIPRGYVQETLYPNGIKTAKKLGCSMLVLNKNLAKKSYLKRAQKKGLHVSIWTVNKTEDMERFISFGADSLISDYPQTAQNLIQSNLKINI